MKEENNRQSGKITAERFFFFFFLSGILGAIIQVDCKLHSHILHILQVNQ